MCWTSCATSSRSRNTNASAAEIYAEDAAEREVREAARTYAAYHVMERGQEWYFKTTPGEELLDACKKLRGYVTEERRARRTNLSECFSAGNPSQQKSLTP